MLRFIFLFFLTTSLFWAEVATVKNFKGKVLIKRDNNLLPIKIGFQIKNEDIILSKKKSNVGLIFYDGTIITLGENSVFKISQYKFNPVKKDFIFNVELLEGSSSFESGKIGKLSPQSVKFKIPEGTIGIRGTKFYVEVPK